MTRLGSYTGSLTLGLLAAGAILRVTQPQRDRLWAAFLIVGLVLAILYLIQNWKDVVVFAGRRSAREGANTALLVAIVLGIVVAINYIANRHAHQWDLTAARQFTLSEQTRQILDQLERDVEIVLLDNPVSQEALQARDLLELYDNAGSRLEVTVIDPEAEPDGALVYQSPTEPITLGTIIVQAGDRRERATAATEPEITNALIRVLKQETKKIYFTAGHQEKDLMETDGSIGLSAIQSRLEGSTYEAEPLVIPRSVVGDEIRIPEDASAVVVAGPRSDFLDEEIEALDRYLREGGNVIFLLDPSNQGETPALTAYLEELGVAIGDNVVLDAYSLPPVSPVVRSYGRHPIVESFGNVMSVFPLARTVARAEEAPEGVEVRELFTTTDEASWAETRLDELSERLGPTPEQERGPLPLAVAVTMEVAAQQEAEAGDEGADAAGEEAAEPTEEQEEESSETLSPEARIVVVGDSDFIANDLATAPVLNADLFLNMVNWVSQDEELISIRPREPEDRRIFLTGQQSTNVLFLSFLIVPGIVLVTGISVWWGRR